MYVGAIHRINDRDAWAAAVRSMDMSIFPAEMELLTSGTSAEADRAVCLWQAPSAEFAQEALDRIFGPVADNECFAVPDEFAFQTTPKAASAGI